MAPRELGANGDEPRRPGTVRLGVDREHWVWRATRVPAWGGSGGVCRGCRERRGDGIGGMRRARTRVGGGGGLGRGGRERLGEPPTPCWYIVELDVGTDSGPMD
ncbi:hypothetical protein E2562_021460 [Oryza meyeriana var. granulata]|uniref:Uncharacterized protein n=1 Tax=Oryza meyeriana var. granulata TaxID=110450 RepID=A0A6G1C6M5_9ORYZ|nr:hypothetical protein E2562_021460 [Oryza meyeriana var. granulata]